MAYYYDPIEMLAEVLKQEYDEGNLVHNKQYNRLERTQGSCHFCVNDDWTFPEGCPYGKNEERAPDPKHFEQIVKGMASRPI